MAKKIWIDLLNPSHPLFFKSIIDELKSDYDFQVTVRQRAETISLTDQLGLHATVKGAYYDEKKMKTIATVNRVITLFSQVDHFDWSLSLENSDCVAASRMRLKKSILLFDNDLKYKQKNNCIQVLENFIKLFANHIIIPKAAEQTFNAYTQRKNVHTFNGYKEDIYLASYKPDPLVKDHIPFDHFVVLRPEALASFYVHGEDSLVPALLFFFEVHKIPVVYLPRSEEDKKLAEDFKAFIPKKPMNGLDLCYYSDAVLTGSGTMAREAACMAKPAVSFFPSNEFLSVDEQLIKEGKMIHSRNAQEIGEYVLTHHKQKTSLDFTRSKKVKKEVIEIIKNILDAN